MNKDIKLCGSGYQSDHVHSTDHLIATERHPGLRVVKRDPGRSARFRIDSDFGHGQVRTERFLLVVDGVQVRVALIERNGRGQLRVGEGVAFENRPLLRNVYRKRTGHVGRSLA
jgi:hypothetical protein